MTIYQPEPEEVYALVVGIEKYQAGSEWDLNGPANDAINFVNWLLERGVKLDNISLFVSPLKENECLLRKTKVESKPASREEISNAITHNFLEQDAVGKLLYVFWGGHGFITKSEKKKRILLFSDTDNKNYKNLDFYSLQEAMETSFLNKGFAKQVYLVDACANAVSNEHFEIAKWEKTGDRFVTNSDQQKNEQFILFAAAEYEIAINRTQRGTGSFSDTVFAELNRLPENSLLPDMHKLAEDAKTILKVEGEPQPIKLYFRDWAGNQGFESFGFRQFDWRGVCSKMLIDRKSLTTNLLASTEGIALQVQDVYIPVGLVERRKQSKHQDNILPEQGSELFKETEITNQFEYSEFLEEVLKKNNSSKSQGKRIAIIGEPGAGKTTLLQQIADWIYNNIEQSIVIWVSLADLKKQELESYLFENWLTAAVRRRGNAGATDQLKDNFTTQFQQGRVWLLLDGLDEMFVSSGDPLTEIALQLRERGAISQARIILTCRVNLWDGRSNALNNFDTYRTLDFSYPNQVETFINSWFSAISEFERERGRRLCTVLQEPVKERIRDLVKNPLRLTLLCLNWQSREGKLPDTKVELYNRFVDDFYLWKKDQFPTERRQYNELINQLKVLAKETIDKTVNRFRLNKEFVSQFLGDIYDKTSLLKLALNLGWLNNVGVDKEGESMYAFFHASFQEYFAALAINDRSFFLSHTPGKPNAPGASYRIFEPQWKEVFLLWLGRQNIEKLQKENLIQSLVYFEDGCQSCYKYRAFFLAARAITEFKECTLSDEIVEKLISYGLGDFDEQKQVWILSSRPIEARACSVLQEAAIQKSIQPLVRLVETAQSEYARMRAADILGVIGIGSDTAIQALVRLLDTAQHEYTRRSAANSLVKIAPGNDMAIQALVRLIETTQNRQTRGMAAYGLGAISMGSDTAIQALVRLLGTAQDENTRRSAAYGLGATGMGNDTAIQALVRLVETAHDKLTRRSAADSLEKIDPGNGRAIGALVRLLEITQDEDTCRSAAYALGAIGTGNNMAICTLMQLLDTARNEETLRGAARSLWEVDPGNNKVIHALERLLDTAQDENTRSYTLYTLEEIAPDNAKAIHTLVRMLASQDESARWCSEYCLEREFIAPGNDTAIRALGHLLDTPQDENTCIEPI